MTDTHAHLYDEQFSDDLDEAIARAVKNGVQRMYLPNCDQHTIASMMQVCSRFPDNCFPMMGLHPCYVKADYEQEIDIVKEWLSKEKFAAVGEIGLDYYWDKTFIAEQKEAFREQIDLASQYDLPIVIHSRASTQDCIDIVKEKQKGQLQGIFHCFGDDMAAAKQIIDLGFKLGIGGVVTFKNSSLPEVLAGIGLEHLVLETDAPYLAPVPYRGKRNESAYIPLIAQKIAEIKNLALEEVILQTDNNAKEIYKL